MEELVPIDNLFIKKINKIDKTTNNISIDYLHELREDLFLLYELKIVPFFYQLYTAMLQTFHVKIAIQDLVWL